MIICDEAHRTTGVTLAGESESAFVRVHDNSYIRADKRLYMTATPRIFRDNVKNVAAEKEAVLTSMDNQELFGPVFHRLGFGEAVKLNLLTDYKVVVLAVPEDEVSTVYQKTAEYGELPLPETAKLVGCWNALAKRKNGFTDTQYGDDAEPMRRAVAFAKDIKTSKKVAAEFPILVNEHLRDLTNLDESDNLEVQCRHVDGTMNAIERGEALDWLKSEAAQKPSFPVSRILTNARCLSEGVDVPTLDAVLFLNPRKSQVEVIQAVGRVMRRAEGKKYGYIILPVAVPAGVSPEEALNDNKRFAVVWQVLQAIRAHDDRFDNTINAIEYNSTDPENIIIGVVNFTKPTAESGDIFNGAAKGSDDPEPGSGGENGTGAGQITVSPTLPGFGASEWKDAVYSKIVKKVGNREYWDDWSKDIADIAGRYISLIERLLEDPTHQDDFATFVDALQRTLNPAIDGAQAVEMLAQHLITKPLFDAMFPDQNFTAQNPVSQAMQGIVDRLAQNSLFEREREPLAKFYETMAEKIRAIDNLAGKQDIMRTLYDKFFTKAFPAMQDRLGIVFTPVPVVDYILHSANDALHKHFGKNLGDPGVAIIEPFLGTGTFVSRLLQSGIIAPDQLEHKYKHEIFANEIVLLSYYIASINIEQVYHEIRKEQGYPDEYAEFPGITLTDTFQMREGEEQLEGVGDFQANLERVQRQRETSIRVVVMNPPYSAGQSSANDNNQNLKYPRLDAQIAATYADRSTATNKNSLYDSYFRALRWASDRIGDEGVIAFVSNSSFIDGNTADGVRLTWQDEFSDICVYNLRGGVRGKIGEAAAREGGNVFPIMTGVAITILVKRTAANTEQRAKIRYAEVPDYLTAQEKLNVLSEEVSLRGTEFSLITPNEHGDWINQRDDSYLEFQAIGDKKTKGRDETPALFQQYSGGLKTNRDAWCYNFHQESLSKNINKHISYLNEQMRSVVEKFGNTATQEDVKAYIHYDSSRGSVDRVNIRDIMRGRLTLRSGQVVPSAYRPFTKMFVYFDHSGHLNNRTYQLPQIFPTPAQPNLAIGATGERRRDFCVLMTSILPDLEMVSKAQWCPLYTWKSTEGEENELSLFDIAEAGNPPERFSGRFDFNEPISSQVPLEIDGYRRHDNITDATLAAYRRHYNDARSPKGEQISKEDIFFYVYALLHHPQYRERYDADLKKMLPRIPKAHDFWSYSNTGRQLAHLHVNYEHIEPYPSVVQEPSLIPAQDEWARYHVKAMQWGKKKAAGKHKNAKDFTTLIYNEYITFTGIPEEANEYKIGGRSPLEWMVDRYKVTADKASGIVNDPNDYCREIDDPTYIANLVPRLVTVSMRTQSLVAGLPEFVITEETSQGK